MERLLVNDYQCQDALKLEALLLSPRLSKNKKLDLRLGAQNGSMWKTRGGYSLFGEVSSSSWTQFYVKVRAH